MPQDQNPTGRAPSRPRLQNIPIDTGQLLAEHAFSWLAHKFNAARAPVRSPELSTIDYSQIELRVLAHLDNS